MTKTYHYICEQCKREFDLTYKKRCKHIYCSHECAGLAKRKRIEKICPICKNKFYVSPSNIDQICCKKECANKYMVGKPNYGERKYKFLETKAIDNPLYKKWRQIKSRLFIPKVSNYQNYGGRGITMCEEWLEFENFYTWAINNGYKEGLTIERIDVNGNYEPNNCCWIPLAEQAKNRTTSIWVEYKDTKMIIEDIAKLENVDGSNLRRLFHKYNDIEKALEIARKNKKGLRITNKSGCAGVYFNGKNYVVTHREKYIGTFKTFEEAVEAKVNAKKQDKKE